MWNLKSDTVILFTKRKLTHRHRNKRHQRRKGVGGTRQEPEVNRCALLHGTEMTGQDPLRASPRAPLVKKPPATRETWVRSLGWEDRLEKEMATHSSILAWRIPWTEEPGRL